MSEQSLEVSGILREMRSVIADRAGLLWIMALPFAGVIGLTTGLVFHRLSLSPVVFAIELAIGFLYQGVTSETLRSIVDHESRQSIGGILRSVAPVVPSIVVAGVFAGVLIGAGFLIILIPGLLLITIWSVFVPVLIYEKEKMFSALERSRKLVKGNGWAVLPVVFGVFLLGSALDLALNGAADKIGSVLWLRMLSTALAWFVVLPIAAVAANVIYLQLRGDTQRDAVD